MRIRPTRHGVLFLIILGAMLAGSVNYNNNAGFILVFLLGGMAFISLFHGKKNLSEMGLSFEPAQPVFAGQAARFPVKIHAGHIDRANLSFRIYSNPPATANLAKNQSTTLDIEAKTTKRGSLTPEHLEIFSVFPLGLFTISTRIPTNTACLVYPAPLAIPGRSGRGGHGLNGDKASNEQGPDDFQGLTLYRPGHDIKRIAWKAVSRGQGMFIKDFSAMTGRFRLLDFYALAPRDTETRLSVLCQMVLLMDRKQEPFGLNLPKNLIEPSMGPPHRAKCLRALALFGRKDDLS